MPSATFSRVYETIAAQPAVDVHAHLGTGGRRQAQTLADIVGYHWLACELWRAGVDLPVLPRGARPDPDAFMESVVPCMPAIRNTSNHFLLMGLLRDLYGFDARTLTADNWRAADAAVRAHAADPRWLHTVLDRGNIQAVPCAIVDGLPDASGRFFLYGYAEPLMAATANWTPAKLVAAGVAVPTTAAALRAAIGSSVESQCREHAIRALHAWVRGTWSYRAVPDAEADPLIARAAGGGTLTGPEQDTLMSWGAGVLAEAAGRFHLVIQLFHGMINYGAPARHHVASYWNPEFTRALLPWAADYPEARFDVYLGTELPSHEMASLARGARNLMISGGWWHGFTPSTLTRFFRDRLELLPHTAWNAFYSDGYMIEWVYGKLLLTRHALARAMSDLVDEGFLVMADVEPVARGLLYENAMRAYGLKPMVA